MQLHKKTRSLNFNLVSILIKLVIALVVFVGIVFLLNNIEFPAPKKTIEKVIPNENFKVIK